MGKTDLHITPLGIGTWAIGGGDWGMGWGPQDERDSIKAILEGLESGINWIDTAHAYGFGVAEEVVAKALREWKEPVVVATKCGVLPDEKRFPRRYISRGTILEEVEGSLRRLGVEVIDLYQLHWPEPDSMVEEAWQTLLDLQKQGKIRWPAVSNFSAGQMERAQRLGPVASLQPRYSLLNRQIETSGQMAWCAAHDCGLLVYSPMESGLLTGKVTEAWIAALPPNDWRRHKPDHPVAALLHPPRKPHFLRLVARLQSIAQESGHSVGQLATAWVLARHEVTSAIVGARRSGQITEIAAAAEWRLGRAELQSIEEAHSEFLRATATCAQQ